MDEPMSDEEDERELSRRAGKIPVCGLPFEADIPENLGGGKLAVSVAFFPDPARWPADELRLTWTEANGTEHHATYLPAAPADGAGRDYPV